MKNKITHILIAVAFALLFSVFLYKYLSLNLWDYDFWWHISTGRYIIENREIPGKDPFSYTSELEENKNLIPERESFILRQYWLGQIVLFLIYKTFSDAGIIIFRAIIFFTIILSILWGLRKKGVSFYLCFLSVFLIGLTTLSFTSERPVLFTMLFSVIVFLILEKFRIERKRSIFLLPPLMLLWANMHGGFILGDAIIGAFMLGESFGIVFKRSSYSRREMIMFYSICVLSIFISDVNPNGFSAFLLNVLPEHKIFLQGIEEYVPTFSLYRDKLRSLDIGYITLVVLFFPILILRIRKMNISHIIILLGLFFMSLYAFRFVIFFVLISAIILITELHTLLESVLNRGIDQKNRERLKSIFAVMTLASSLSLFINILPFNQFHFKKAVQSSVPEYAVDFIETTHLSGNLYNDFVFGGYVIWRLYPWKKNFIDTRSINYTVLSEARWINFANISLHQTNSLTDKAPLWERLLNHYNIDIVLLDTLDVHGSITPLVLTLLENNKWVPVYANSISVIFVRNAENNKEVIKKYRIQKDTVFAKIIERALRGALKNKNNPNYLISLGDVFLRMGRTRDALTAYDYAIQRLPKSNPVRDQIEKIRKEL